VIYPRVIPALLIEKNRLIQTRNFEYLKYLGDPLNAIRIFNEKKVDELVFFDISASSNNLEPNFNLISNMSKESRMPLCYGGGIKNLTQFEKIINLGVEKISMSSSAILNDEILIEASKSFGSQSVIVTLDIKKIDNQYFVYIENGSKKVDIDLVEIVKRVQDNGAGELIFNLIDKDGTRSGYDIRFIKYIKDLINIPISILGGASSYDDFVSVLQNFGLIGLCAGSMFSLKGKFNSVLLQYLDEDEKNDLRKILHKSFKN
jgi:cyclase